MSKSFPEWWKHGQKVRTANDGVLTLNIAEDSEYWLTNNAGKEVSVFSMDILGPASVPEACSMTTDITELAQSMKPECISPERMEWLKKLADMKYCASNPGHWLMSLKETNYLAVVALKCIENNLSLADALEKAQQRIDELDRKNCELDSLTQRWAVERAENADRIAELESRIVTVKLTDINEYLAEVHDKTLNRAFRLLAEGVRAGDVAAMRAAGIKVEAE